MQLRRSLLISCLIALVTTFSSGGEKRVVSLRDFRTTEVKSAGIRIPRAVKIRITGLGGGGGSGWISRDDGMFASGWIIDAVSRSVVWEMNPSNTEEAEDYDRSCDDKITLKPGEYEIYFAAPTFSYRSWGNHVVLNVDHRQDPLFDEDNGGFLFFKGFWSDDIPEEWEKRAQGWGIDLWIDDENSSRVETFSPVKEQRNIVLAETGLGDDAIVRQGLKVKSPVSVNLYALGEERKDQDLVDFGWLVSTETRKRVWEMNLKNTHHAGGAEKNIIFSGSLRLPAGEYVLYYVTDDSHSPDDWNSFPPHDPFNYGITITADHEDDPTRIDLFDYDEEKNVIVSITRAGDDEDHREGFTLNKDAKVRVYAFGERGLGRRSLADFGYILDARTREKVWFMDVDRCRHAGGATKNVMIDEVISLSQGSYLVIYNTDDSHSYGDWNATPPFDQEFYGITVMGAGPDFNMGTVGKYVDPREEGVVAQIIRIRNNADESKRFRLDRTSRIRVYAIGEGQKRTMYDYGWIESVSLGTVVWEMTYNMTFHAGGGRKNRMVNTSIVLDKGEYILRYVSDDSHSYNSWNTDPPEDSDYWGVTLYDESSEAAAPVPPPAPPAPDR